MASEGVFVPSGREDKGVRLRQDSVNQSPSSGLNDGHHASFAAAVIRLFCLPALITAPAGKL